MWENLTPKVMKEYFWDTSPLAKLIRVYTKRTKKMIETVNVVIDEVSDSVSEKIGEEIPKEILSSEPQIGQEIRARFSKYSKCCRSLSRHSCLTSF